MAPMTPQLEYFLNVYEEIKVMIMDDSVKRYELDVDRRRYLEQMMDTTCLGGKYNRGLCVMDVAEAMASEQSHLNKDERQRLRHDAAVCGWMIEMLQAHFLMEDDIMDNSQVRRGAPCWYLHPGVTTQVAINDGLIVLAWATKVAHHYFCGRDALLARILYTFHEVDMTTAMGQLYDVTSMVDSKRLDPMVPHGATSDYVEFTLFNYRRIVVYKTAYYTYWLPLQMGLIVSGTISSVDSAAVHKVSMVMGEYFQVQDDVMDCFTPPEILGKVGTDIQDAKCSWLAVTFLAKATPAQKKKFIAAYGSHDAKKVAEVKALFKEAKLEKAFEAYEKEVVEEVGALLKKISSSSPSFGKSVEMLWKKTYKRVK